MRVLLILLLLASPAHAFRCDVARVIDGDGWICAGIAQPIRAFGYDAPDWNCRGRRNCALDPERAAAAKAHLEGLVLGKALTCELDKIDRYKRLVARCFVGGLSIDCLMIKSGHGVEMERFTKGAYRGCRP